MRAGPNSSPEFNAQTTLVYEEILTYVHNVLVVNTSWADALSRKESAQHLIDFLPKIADWGSDSVISYDVARACLRLKQAVCSYASGPSLITLCDQLWALEELLLTVRADLGYETGFSERGDLLPCFVADLYGYLEDV
jgi:hypothetical protein